MMGVRVTRGVLVGSLYLIMITMMTTMSSASVVLMGSNLSLYFQDMEADFAAKVKSNGVVGKLYISEPVDACSPLTSMVEQDGNYTSPFVLILRGVCSFEDKVRMAQQAGFKAAIIYDYEDSSALVAMAGNSAGINIPAVFVSKATGEKLMTYVGLDIEVWILPGFDYTTWSIMAISFFSLLAMSAILATCFFVRRHQIRRERPRGQVREFHGMSRRLVMAIPSLIFTAVTEDNCTSSTCAICLEDYMVGDKLRILPCCHKFHAFCVDSWLTTWRTFCPVCKRDARTSTGELPASESTPLLSSHPSSASSTPLHSSAIPISSPTPRSSSSMTLSRSSLDLRTLSSQRSFTSQFYSPHSLGYPPSSPPLNARFMSPHVRSPSHGSSIRQPNTLHYSASATSFSPRTSAQSLPKY